MNERSNPAATGVAATSTVAVDPDQARAMQIPKIIHQTYRTRHLPEELARNVERLKALNPGWTYRLYDDDDIIAFIRQAFGPEIEVQYRRINPYYGAARADLFRYLLMFKVGGVYLDIKSVCDRPFDDVIAPADEYILAHWRNGKEERYEQHGMHKELAAMPRGEFQQWHIICRPGHPFLKAVIDRVLHNIDVYAPWRDGIGKEGVLRLTGPIAYTLAIQPICNDHAHRFVNDIGELGLHYSAFQAFSHLRFFGDHYTTRLDSIVQLSGSAARRARVYRAYRAVRQTVARSIWYPLQRLRAKPRRP